MMSTNNNTQLEIELRRKVPLSEASRLTNLSPDTIRRRYPDKIVRLSPRRVGMTLRDVLAIGGKSD
jgi:hypothetical protein